MNKNKFALIFKGSFLMMLLFTVLIFMGCNENADMKNTSSADTTKKTKSSDNKMEEKKSSMSSMDAMNSMMDKMHAMKMAGNMDVDFVNMMIVHHQSAIDMSKNEIITGKDEKVKKMAENIIKDQAREIEAMQKWLDANKDKKSAGGDNSMKLMGSMKGMMSDMKMSGDADKDFLSMMIMHHEGAIDMSDVEVKNGSDNEIKKMAADIIAKQKEEIKQMKEWQK